MRRSRFLFWLDVILLLFVLALQEPRITSLPVHEWAGIAILAFLAVHLLLNWGWIVAALRRPGKNALLNGLLFIAMALAAFTGVLISEVVSQAVGFKPTDLSLFDDLHSLFANTAFVVVGAHLALNWDWITSVFPTLGQKKTEPGTLGMGEAGEVAARSLWITIAAAALCVVLFLPVHFIATEKLKPHTEPTFPRPDFKGAPLNIAGDLLLVLGAAVVGRKVLKFRL